MRNEDYWVSGWVASILSVTSFMCMADSGIVAGSMLLIPSLFLWMMHAYTLRDMQEEWPWDEMHRIEDAGRAERRGVANIINEIREDYNYTFTTDTNHKPVKDREVLN